MVEDGDQDIMLSSVDAPVATVSTGGDTVTMMAGDAVATTAGDTATSTVGDIAIVTHDSDKVTAEEDTSMEVDCE